MTVAGAGRWTAKPMFVSQGLESGLPLIATHEQMVLRFSNMCASGEIWEWNLRKYQEAGLQTLVACALPCLSPRVV